MWPPWKRMTWLSVLLADLMSEFSSHRTTTATGQPFNAAGTVRIKSQTACAVCIVSLETQQSFCQQFGLLICKVFISNRPSAVRRVMFLYRVTSLTACNPLSPAANLERDVAVLFPVRASPAICNWEEHASEQLAGLTKPLPFSCEEPQQVFVC